MSHPDAALNIRRPHSPRHEQRAQQDARVRPDYVLRLGAPPVACDSPCLRLTPTLHQARDCLAMDPRSQSDERLAQARPGAVQRARDSRSGAIHGVRELTLSFKPFVAMFLPSPSVHVLVPTSQNRRHPCRPPPRQPTPRRRISPGRTYRPWRRRPPRHRSVCTGRANSATTTTTRRCNIKSFHGGELQRHEAAHLLPM